jgi:MYXO-CTERM domain-containing protein
MKHKPFPLLLGGLVAALSSGGAGCSSEQHAIGRESVASSQAALSGNSNYFISAADPTASTGLPITGLTVAVTVTQDLHIPNGMSIQLNAYSAPDSTITWQQYGFAVTLPTLEWSIENWPTDAERAALGLPAGASLNFTESVLPSLPTVPYDGILPAGYILALTLQNDASGNISGASYSVTDACGHTTAIGPAEIVGQPLAPSGATNGGTIPESAISPIYAFQLNLVNQPGTSIVFSSGAGTITYSAGEPLYASQNGQPSWTAAQGIVTGENSSIAYGELPSGPSSTIVQPFGLLQCLCAAGSASSCVTPTGVYQSICTGCAAAPSGSACVLTCTSCTTANGAQNPNPSVQMPCGGAFTNGQIANNNGELEVQCFYAPSDDAGIGIDAGCVSSSGIDAGSDGTDGEGNGIDGEGNGIDGGSSGDLDVTTSEKDASSGSGDGGSGDAATNGGDSSAGGPSSGSSLPASSSSGCGCSLPALQTASPTQSFAALAVAALIGFGRRRKRGAYSGDRVARTVVANVVRPGWGGDDWRRRARDTRDKRA